jgi:hypothetical protein
MTAELLALGGQFLIETGLSGHRFGLLASRDGRLVERLRKGGRVSPEKEAEIGAFIIAERRGGSRKGRRPPCRRRGAMTSKISFATAFSSAATLTPARHQRARTAV